MTDQLNQAGIEKAADEIQRLCDLRWTSHFVRNLARAAITAYLECARNSSEDAGPDRGLRAPCGGGAASSAPAPTPETREPSEEAMKCAGK